MIQIREFRAIFLEVCRLVSLQVRSLMDSVSAEARLDSLNKATSTVQTVSTAELKIALQLLGLNQLETSAETDRQALKITLAEKVKDKQRQETLK